jgi:hypothetical protein
VTAWTITVPRALSSQNRAATNGRGQFGARYRDDRGKWVWDITMAMRSAAVPKATGKRRITITRLMGKGQREWDVPNLWGGIKLPLDACCADRVFRGKNRAGAGLIVDDAAKWADIEVKQERAADGKAATRIVVEDIEQEGVL